MKKSDSFADVSPEQYDQFYTVDWRFFIPISFEKKILVVGNGAAETVLFFRKIGVQVDVCNYDLVLVYPDTIYDTIIIPDSSGFIEEPILFIKNIKKLLKKDGVLLVGFLNRFFYSRWKNKKQFTSTIYMMRKRLSSFKQIEILGCFPELKIPEYIFPIDLAVSEFVLKHRYRYRFPSIFLSLITSPLFLPIFIHFLPAYYIIATSEN